VLNVLAVVLQANSVTVGMWQMHFVNRVTLQMPHVIQEERLQEFVLLVIALEGTVLVEVTLVENARCFFRIKEQPHVNGRVVNVLIHFKTNKDNIVTMIV
jgi:hypothetical protein